MPNFNEPRSHVIFVTVSLLAGTAILLTPMHDALAQSLNPSKLMKKFDRNGDGRISRKEWKRPGRAFKKFDGDANGFLTRKELDTRPRQSEDNDNNAMQPQGTNAITARSNQTVIPSSEDIAAFSPTKSKLRVMRARGFIATGLKPIYPVDAHCLPGTSDFASRTRSDGSQRSRKFYRGLHGGYDIPAPEGTSLLAVADGTVVHKNAGRSIGGIGIILQHTPEDTKLGAWVYTEYKHLMEMPNIELGQRINKGQKIGLSGKTGTTGGHYGSAGFAHLHLTAWYSDRADYTTGKMFIPVNGRWLDPLALFRIDTLHESASLQKLEVGAKMVSISYVSSDGRIHPKTSKVVWPFACALKS